MGEGGGHAVPKPPTGIQKQHHLQPIPLVPLLQDSKPLKTPLASPSRLLFKFEFPNHSLSTPECPFEVANTPDYNQRARRECFRGLTYGSCGGEEDKLERKTSAKPGAGTRVVHVLLGTLQ